MSVRIRETLPNAPVRGGNERRSACEGLSHRWSLVVAMAALAVCIVTASVVGPLVLGAFGV